MLKNKTSFELLQLTKSIVQPMASSMHKGQAGRVVVIGGSEDYTGAPYFAAHSAGLVGADLSHIVCDKAAGPVIKVYSPDLMVHPYLYQLSNPEVGKKISEAEIEKLSKLQLVDVVCGKQPELTKLVDEFILPKVMGVLNRADVVIAGPGFGRDPLMLRTLVRIIEEIKVLNKAVILDADALFLLSIKPDIIKGYAKATLTPNPMEFSRIAQKLGMDNSLKESNKDKLRQSTIELSSKLGNVTVVRKGQVEWIARGEQCISCEVSGSPRRVGGQGDTLTGALATFSVWAENYNNGLWDTDKSLSKEDSALLACFAASSLVRVASRLAFRNHGRAMQASNVHNFIGEAYHDFYESDDYVKL